MTICRIAETSGNFRQARKGLFEDGDLSDSLREMGTPFLLMPMMKGELGRGCEEELRGEEE